MLHYPVLMSTGKHNKQPNVRFAELAKQGEVVFHTKDLANLWGITNSNTLHTTLKRYVQNGLLHRIYKGFYALHPTNDLNPYLLGIKALHNYAYISTETVLHDSGIIMQSIPYITLISNRSKRFTIGERYYRSRKLQDKYLYYSIEINHAQKDIPEVDGWKMIQVAFHYKNGWQKIKWATVERAVADLLYFNPRAHFDNEQKINWERVRETQKKIGYPLTPHRYPSYDSSTS